jgi:acyl carrier protein
MNEKQNEIYESVKKHLAGRGIDESKVKPEASLLEDLDLDSLDTMELTVAMEEQYSIEIPDEDLENLATVQDAVDLIESKASVKT